MRRFMASQLRQPSGWFGSLFMGRLLNRVNAEIVEATLALLGITPEHDVLEIGFGGGSALRRLTGEPRTGVITGLDLSPEMVARAQRNFRRRIEAGQLQLQLGSVAHLPFPDAVFDRVFTINTIYFWQNAAQGLAEIYRVLRPGGLAAIGIRSKEKMEKHAITKYDFRLFSPEDVSDLMAHAGFRSLRIDHRHRDRWYDQVIVIGAR
jgi:ubiquinone/menaquinone biosynthesis C-methylase UbiE